MNSGVRVLIRRVLLIVAVLSVCVIAEMVLDATTGETTKAAEVRYSKSPAR